MKKIFKIAILLFFSQNLFAKNFITDLKSDEDFHYNDYYKIKEDPRLQNINLMNFTHIGDKLPYPDEAYNRKVHFGTWILDPDGSCMNTRGKVLVRDTHKTVSFNANGCTVSKGEWLDPYTAKTFTAASDIQIDHLVPLKNAYMTGAHEWDYQKRCLYANYLGNNFHLLSVYGKENLHKSDKSPSGYMPPNANYKCQYLKEWLEVKVIWSLRVTPKEAEAIKNIYTSENCKTNDFLIANSEIKAQRQFMADHADLCHD